MFVREDASVPGADGDGDDDPAAVEIQELVNDIGQRLTKAWVQEQVIEGENFVRWIQRRGLQPAPSPTIPSAQPRPPLSPITLGLLEDDGELSPDSLAAAQLFKSATLHTEKNKLPQPPADESSDETGPESSPIKGGAGRTKRGAVWSRGRTLVQASSAVVDSSPEPEGNHTDEEQPVPTARTRRTQPTAVLANPAKRSRTDDPISDVDAAPAAPRTTVAPRRSSTRRPQLPLAPIPDRPGAG
jgi:hypothetical protein